MIYTETIEFLGKNNELEADFTYIPAERSSMFYEGTPEDVEINTLTLNGEDVLPLLFSTEYFDIDKLINNIINYVDECKSPE